MTSLFRKFTHASLAFSLVLLSGCTLQEIDKMGAQARRDGDTAQRILQSRAGHSQPVVTWTDKPWVNLTPIPTADMSVTDGYTVPDCPVVINSGGSSITLTEIGQRITATCGLRVSVTPDAMQYLGTTVAAGSTQQISGTLPAPDDNGRVPLATIGNTPAPQQAAPVLSGSGSLTGFKWDGNLRGLLDTLSSRLGLSVRTENGAVVFYRYDTRTYQLAILNTISNASARIDSGTGSQLGSTGTSASSSGDASSAQKTGFDLNSNLYDDLKKTVENMLTPQVGRYWLSSSSGTLTVTDTPEVLGRVGRFVEYENKVLNRQIQLDVKIMSVTQTRNEELGLDWDLVYSSLRNYGVSVKGSFNNASSGAASGAYSILDTATGSARHFAGSNLIMKALSEQGDVSVVTSQSRATTNLTPVPYQLSNQQGILVSSSSTSTANVGVTSTMSTSMLTTGLFMTAVPYIEENGNVQLQFAFSYDSPPKIESFFSADGNTRNDTPNYSREAFTQKVNMKAGQTLMLTGSDQLSVSADRQGTGSADNFLFGGGRKGTNKRTTLIILITPILMN